MGMMGMFKWLRKDVRRDRNGWHMASKHYGLNNESYRNALQAFIDRRRFPEDITLAAETPCSPEKRRAELLVKNNNNENSNKCDNEWKKQETKAAIPGVPHIRPSEIFEIGWVAGTEDRYLELIFAEWQNTRVSLKRHTHPECRDVVKADLDVLSEVRHPNVLLLMATTQTDDHGLVSIFESVDCTLYNYIHEQGERLCIQGIAKCGGKLSDALRHSHMRGYVHGAISSHCVYLASSGVVKLGGWELAVRLNTPKPSREYEERLQAEIFRWLAPEMYYGVDPRKESDVYGLALLIWEMCTMQVPWSGLSRADVERQYVQRKRGVIMDLYDFPPLLNNLLEAGLQLDITKRTLDMNRMRRFLQRLEMQYEDEQPVYIDQYSNNNNETGKTYAVPVKRSPSVTKQRNSRLRKSASAKQLSYSSKTSMSPSNHYLCGKRFSSTQSTNSKAPALADQINYYDKSEVDKSKNKDDVEKNMDLLRSVRNNKKRLNSISSVLDDSETLRNEVHCVKSLPWCGTYKKVNAKAQRDQDSRSTTASVYSITSPDSTDEESYKDARTSLKQLKEDLANKREHFFYGCDSGESSQDSTSPKNKILAEVRSADYEPHKPASHRTSLEPKCSKSPGQYDPSYMKSSFEQYWKVPYAQRVRTTTEKSQQSEELNPEAQSFFESSLWRKEKLICISKMRKSLEDPSATFTRHSDNSNVADVTCSKEASVGSDSVANNLTHHTYTVHSNVEGNPETSEEEYPHVSESTYGASEAANSQTVSLQVLKDALDRATELVRSVTPNTDDSCPSPPFKSYQTFDIIVEDAQGRKAAFEDMYDLKAANESENIRSIERYMSGNETFALVKKDFNTGSTKSTETDESDSQTTTVNCGKSRQASHDASYSRTFVCESIAEVSSEFNASYSDTTSDNKTKYSENEESASKHKTEAKVGSGPTEKVPAVTNFALLLNDNARHKNCQSCIHSGLPRRRSLPAALSQLRAINSSALGKLPIRKGDVTDNTVEDLYIDDEFGDSLNVNMILLNEELSLDEDFLSNISEL